jgi:hypothetical protein
MMNFKIYTLQYQKGDQIKECEIHEAYRMHEEKKKVSSYCKRTYIIHFITVTMRVCVWSVA